MKNHDELSKSLIGFGIPIGALAGIVTSLISRTELTYVLPLGIPGGFLTAALITIVISRTGWGETFTGLTLVGLGPGAVVGAAMGALAAWTLNGDYLSGFLLGGGLGLTAGVLLIFLVTYFGEQNNE